MRVYVNDKLLNHCRVIKCMKAYLAIKFHEDCKNRKLIENISEFLEESGYETICMIRDYEKWGL